ncbi:hypothetical protein QBC40DRAFT_254358 [Triangularia verruculosa]|uniref:Uncharacterized protein n=1 Tax=Triangularia verruculosa TaxID=2587418 RepID=A0AAN6XIA8_9PEZI|nr:hypothetical protein QBC40DRAFT_254358 [Triangularia verruculosa]
MALCIHHSRRRTGPSPNGSESTLEIDLRPPEEHNHSTYNSNPPPSSSTWSFFPETDLHSVEGYNAHYQRRSRTPDPYHNPPSRHRRSRSHARGEDVRRPRRSNTVTEERLREEYLDRNENITDTRDTYISTPRSSHRHRRGRSVSVTDRVRETETFIETRHQEFTDLNGNPAFFVDSIAVRSGDSSEQRARDRRRADREVRRESRGTTPGPMPAETEGYAYDGLEEVLDRPTLRRVRALMSFDPWRGFRDSRRRR